MRRILAQIPGIDPDRARLCPLSGGITNRNYRVEADWGACVLRIGGKGARELGIDRGREYECARLAAAAGVGPEVLLFIPSEQALVTRFIEGEKLTPRKASKPGTLKRIVASIRRIHSGPDFPGRFSPFETVRRYHQSALKSRVVFPTETRRAFGLMTSIEKALGKPWNLTPCHNDLLAGNFIDDGRGIRVLDWEYAAMGDPFFDLGNLAANLELREKDCRFLLTSYFSASRPSALARLYLMRLASDLRESLWGFLQSGLSTLDFDFRKYALKHLRRFLKSASSPRFERWLKQGYA